MSRIDTIPAPPKLLESAGLILPSDPELALPEVRATNRQLRLLVAAWMIEGSAKDALALYPEHQLNRPGRLTQADIEVEVWKLVDIHNEVEEAGTAA